jgi:hypothetical protein
MRVADKLACNLGAISLRHWLDDNSIGQNQPIDDGMYQQTDGFAVRSNPIMNY